MDDSVRVGEGGRVRDGLVGEGAGEGKELGQGLEEARTSELGRRGWVGRVGGGWTEVRRLCAPGQLRWLAAVL